LPIAAIVAIMGSALTSTVNLAQALLITEQEHWKYNVDKWAWDADRRRTYGIITPQVIIQNETADRLEGYVADANGTRLDIYDGDQMVMVRFLSDIGIGSDWVTAGRVHDGYFAIDIPEQYKENEIVKIYIGTNQYTVDNGTSTTAQTWVFINAAMLNYRTNSTLDHIPTEIAQVEDPVPVRSIYDRGSLIDYILSLNGMLPVRSPDSGE